MFAGNVQMLVLADIAATVAVNGVDAGIGAAGALITTVAVVVPVSHLPLPTDVAVTTQFESDPTVAAVIRPVTASTVQTLAELVVE